MTNPTGWIRIMPGVWKHPDYGTALAMESKRWIGQLPPVVGLSKVPQPRLGPFTTHHAAKRALERIAKEKSNAD